jgi:hypothetical protein
MVAQSSVLPSSLADTRETSVQSPVMGRLERVVKAITSTPRLSSHSTTRIALMIYEEAVIEARESGMTDEFIAEWISVFGEVFKWCGTGDDSMIPESIRNFIGTNEPDSR